MAASQFIIYSSSDPFGPGVITGLTGSLISVLDACLVNGYSGKPSAGWTKPIGNYSASLGSVPVLGCYQQGSGSKLDLFINDAGGNATANGKEAWATGWETITALTSSNTANMTGSVGSGYGQFPMPAQLLIGNVILRKSVSADAVSRFWIMFADASTFYLFVASGDAVTAGVYMTLWFGDVFSLKGASDAYRCMIVGRQLLNNGVSNDSTDQMATFNVTPASFPAHYIARSYGGFGSSIAIIKLGDIGKTGANNNYSLLGGSVQMPNGPDNSYYVSPLSVGELLTPAVRGRFRGMYHVCHQVVNFSDGQTFQGSGDFAGKTFQTVKPGTNAGMWVIETSATTETN